MKNNIKESKTGGQELSKLLQETQTKQPSLTSAVWLPHQHRATKTYRQAAPQGSWEVVTQLTTSFILTKEKLLCDTQMLSTLNIFIVKNLIIIIMFLYNSVWKRT